MIAGVLLAAGRSQRMGQPKLLLPWNGVPLVRHVAQNVLQSDIKQLVVVVGHRAPHVEAALDGLPVQIVRNAAFLEGQSISVRAGVAALDQQTEAALILLADQPLVQPTTLNLLIHTYHNFQASIVIPRFNGQRGNPVLFGHQVFEQLQQLQGDQGARPILQTYAAQTRFVDVDDEGVVLDIDTPENYEKVLARASFGL
jgi:molybdenum cofactor cytidylyltransferase